MHSMQNSNYAVDGSLRFCSIQTNREFKKWLAFLLCVEYTGCFSSRRNNSGAYWWWHGRNVHINIGLQVIRFWDIGCRKLFVLFWIVNFVQNNSEIQIWLINTHNTEWMILKIPKCCLLHYVTDYLNVRIISSCDVRIIFDTYSWTWNNAEIKFVTWWVPENEMKIYMK